MRMHDVERNQLPLYRPSSACRRPYLRCATSSAASSFRYCGAADNGRTPDGPRKQGFVTSADDRGAARFRTGAVLSPQRNARRESESESESRYESGEGDVFSWEVGDVWPPRRHDEYTCVAAIHEANARDRSKASRAYKRKHTLERIPARVSTTTSRSDLDQGSRKEQPSAIA